MAGAAHAGTPLMAQYESVRARYPGHLVLFRVGDFYETFGEDAKLLARELEVVLTARAADGHGERMPMAGVPYHAVETYLGRLVRKGYKVALCDQVEDASEARGLVRREVTRVVTPGTVLEDRILPGPAHNFLAAVVAEDHRPAAFACVDITTGEMFAGRSDEGGAEGLLHALAPFQPRELLTAGAVFQQTGPAIETRLRREFSGLRVEPAPPPIGSAELPAALASASELSDPEREAISRLCAYVRATQPRLLPYLELRPRAPEGRRLRLDAKTLRHLEISRPMNPDDPGGATLLATWDATVTASGRRTFEFWLKNPLADVGAVRARQDAVEALVGRGAALLALREELKRVTDLSRTASRVVGRRVRGAELVHLADSLEAVGRVQSWLQAGLGASTALAGLLPALDPLTDLQARLRAALPAGATAGHDEERRFRPGFSEELDSIRRAEEESLARLQALERKEQAATGIRGLKIGYNQVFGYYFEITRPNLGRVPEHFHRKQTLAQAERFTTEELARVEEALLTGREEREQREARLWEEFLVEIERWTPRLHRVSRAVGELDALAAFGLLAQERQLVRPTVDESTVLQIREGRHPVLERLLAGEFVPNDTDLDGDGTRLLVLTGPNMSGKSTYMRQLGLLVLLAQVGAFVPARHMRLGLVSSLFTRMGFTDEIGRGKSSFMVEMSEVGEILRAADERSLVLLDEVGRGTSTFDGLAIAWATLRHLHERVRARTLLATHYHQLTELVASLPHAGNAHMAVSETGGEVVFLHRLVPGSTDRSYGLHVARLAGLPPELLEEAKRLLKRLESDGLFIRRQNGRARPVARYTQAVLLPGPESDRPSDLERALLALAPDELTPVEALNWIVRWRRRLAGETNDGPGAGTS